MSARAELKTDWKAKVRTWPGREKQAAQKCGDSKRSPLVTIA